MTIVYIYLWCWVVMMAMVKEGKWKFWPNGSYHCIYGNEKSNLLCVHESVGKFCWYLPIFELNSTSPPEELGHKKGRWQHFRICEINSWEHNFLISRQPIHAFEKCVNVYMLYHPGLAQKEIELWERPSEEMKKYFKLRATIF